jgi:biotin synthase
MLTPAQALKLKDAGLDAYNHNLDTSRDYYGKIISTRTYDDRLKTIQSIRSAGITVCSGGIIGMGESPKDRCGLLAELAALDPQPESVPINLLIPVEGTPLEDAFPVEVTELVRTVAVARILMPKARVRLSAGRTSLSSEAQILAFFAGANSIFLGEKLLTRPNPTVDEDERLLASLAGATISI